MNIFQIVAKGFQTTNSRWRVVLYLWIVNFFVSLLALTPFYLILNKEFSHSLVGEQISRGLNFLWIGDIIHKYKDFSPGFVGWILASGFFFILVSVFLAGGILGRIAAEGETVDLENFFLDCGKHFFRLFRVFLLSLAFYVVIFGAVFRAITVPLNFWVKHAGNEWPGIISAIVKLIAAVLLFTIVRMFFDYVRVRLVVEKSRKTVRATLLTSLFVGKRFFRAWLLYLCIGILVVLFALAFLLICQFLPKTGIFLLLVFFFQQVYILSKMWTKTLFFAAEYHFFKNY